VTEKGTLTGTVLIVAGTVLILVTPFADLILSKGSINVGPRSILLIFLGILSSVSGYRLRKNRTGFSDFAGIILAATVMAHVLCLFHVFPLSEITTGDPIVTIDYGFHFNQNYTVCRFLSESGQTWGYDPYFMAGYPMGVIFDFNNKASEYFSFIFSFIGIGNAFNLFFLLFYSLMPLLIYLSAKNFGSGKKEALLAAALCVLFWVTDSSMRWSYFCGMYSFSIVSFCCVYVFSLFYKWIEEPGLKNLLFAFISGILIFFIPSSSFILFFPLSACFFVFLKRKDFKRIGIIFLWAALIISFSSFWLVPFFKFQHYKISSAQFLIETPLTLLKDLFTLDWLNPGTGGFRRTLFVRWIIIFFGIYGLTLWKKKNNGLRFLSFVSLAAGMFFLSYFGSYTNFTRELQPYRFMLPLTFFLSVPASGALFECVNRAGGIKKKPVKVFYVIILLFCIPLLYDSFRQFFTFTWATNSRMSADEKEIIAWIKKNTDRSARILYEDTDFPVVIINKVKREFIGGPYLYTFIKHSFASFRRPLLSERRDRLFGKAFSEITPEMLNDYIEYYNILWVFAFWQDSRDFFKSHPRLFEKIHSIGHMDIYRAKRKPDYFLKGSGSVAADYNKIEVKNARGNELVLKYHWLETLKTMPEMKIEEVRVLDDPVGFIKIYNNGAFGDFTIYNAYR
jgi:hypothetical protein